jgi:hypothetical protein
MQNFCGDGLRVPHDESSPMGRRNKACSDILPLRQDLFFCPAVYRLGALGYGGGEWLFMMRVTADPTLLRWFTGKRMEKPGASRTRNRKGAVQARCKKQQGRARREPRRGGGVVHPSIVCCP